MATTNRQWLLASRPEGAIKDSDFTWSEQPLPSPGDGQVLVRNVYISLDPTNRIWIAQDSYLPAVAIGAVVRGGAIGAVEKSNHPGFAPGDIVQGMIGWQDYAVMQPRELTKLPPLPLPLTAHFGLLGHIGLTAYYGLLDIAKPKEGETLVVSGAAGAVGSLVGQIGKIKGCRVVGIAGSDEKCHWLTGELGFDAAINYRTEKVSAALRVHCPKGIDVYFENVGGEILDAVLGQINNHARISLCGLISGYNATQPVRGPANFANVLTRRARIEGFIIIDYLDRAEPAARELIGWHMQGKLKYRVDVVDGLENAPRTLRKLFDGSNRGKLILKVSEEPAKY